MVRKIRKFFVVWANPQTLLAATWRFFVALFDWRTMLRRISRRPIIDAVFVSNMRDEVDRQRCLSLWHPKSGHFNGPRYWVNGIAGRTRVLDIVTEDLATSEGREKAKEYFIRAVQWAKNKGTKVILLAASTKRLFGDDGAQLKENFPDLIFTIGDNGTFFLLREETTHALRNANLRPGHCRIAILGPYGLLGEMMAQALAKDEGYNIIGVGPNISALKRISRKYGIDTCRSFSEIGKVDAVVACTHSEKIRLNTENIELIRHPEKKLLVIDVAEPSNLRYQEYQKCRGTVVRQDAGNAYSPKLKYVLGAISYKMFRLSRGVTFGCFAETLSLAGALKQDMEVKGIDWFTVSANNMEVIAELFKKDGFTLPSPRCFGEEL
ncbi:MAG: hypothetical protein CO106_02615 [Deltaproteobacteria bacterium CG_4_9_14_3_um_filter_44_9]|nr:MAG: hypothetical protein CO106_02615 [Deltaproteobacteria bacterium CG_4_9_14_3_um_filter_44_9]